MLRICVYEDKNGFLTVLVAICTLSEPGYEFDKASLLAYNHMSFGGPPISVETIEEERELLSNNEQESAVGNQVKKKFLHELGRCLNFC